MPALESSFLCHADLTATVAAHRQAIDAGAGGGPRPQKQAPQRQVLVWSSWGIEMALRGGPPTESRLPAQARPGPAAEIGKALPRFSTPGQEHRPAGQTR